VFTEPLPGNRRLFWLQYSGFQALCHIALSLRLLSNLRGYNVGIIIIIIIIVCEVRLSPLGTAATTGLLYQPQMIDEGDCGEIGGMKIGRGNRSNLLVLLMREVYKIRY
jgi:hypothetical protein